MITGPLIAEIAMLVGEPARATMLSALLDGRALTASELAFAARITPQTASTHLAKLTEAGLLSVIREGRHRYFRLASPKVVEMIDGIVAVALETRPRYRPLSLKHENSVRREFATTTLPVVSAWTSPIFSLRASTSRSATKPRKSRQQARGFLPTSVSIFP